MRIDTLLAVLAAAALAACASSTANNGGEKAAKKDAPAKIATVEVPPLVGDFDPETVVLTMGSSKLTLADLDKHASEEIGQMRREHFRKLAEVRERALDAYVNDKLLADEAKRQGLEDAEALLDKEIEKKIPEVTDAAAKKFFEENSDRMTGMSFDDTKDRIKQFITAEKRRELYATYIDGLRKTAKVALTLPVVRTKVDTSGPAKGPKTAPVTIVEFSDYECPFCGKAQAAIKQVLEEYGQKVRLVFKDYPLGFHTHAIAAAAAARCAGEQGKYWEMHDKLFENQTALEKDDLAAHAKAIDDLDYAKWIKCLESDVMTPKIMADMEIGKKAGVDGTPAFFINGIMLGGARPFADFKKVIDSELARLAKSE